MQKPGQSLLNRVKNSFKLRFKPPANLAEVVLSIVDPRSPYLIGAFVFGFFLLSNWGNFFYTWIQEGFPSKPEVWGRFGWSSLVLAAGAVILYLLDLWRRQRKLRDSLPTLHGTWGQSQEAKHYPGLITVFSAFNPATTRTAVLYHSQPDIPKEQRLKYCWCIMDQAKETREKFLHFKSEETMQQTGVEFLSYSISDAENVQQIYAAVDDIYQDEIEDWNLQPADVVTDITAGLKPMSVGMAFACLMHDRNLEYIHCRGYDKATGLPNLDTAKVIELDLKFYLEE